MGFYRGKVEIFGVKNRFSRSFEVKNFSGQELISGVIVFCKKKRQMRLFDQITGITRFLIEKIEPNCDRRDITLPRTIFIRPLGHYNRQMNFKPVKM